MKILMASLLSTLCFYSRRGGMAFHIGNPSTTIRKSLYGVSSSFLLSHTSNTTPPPPPPKQQLPPPRLGELDSFATALGYDTDPEFFYEYHGYWVGDVHFPSKEMAHLWKIFPGAIVEQVVFVDEPQNFYEALDEKINGTNAQVKQEEFKSIDDFDDGDRSLRLRELQTAILDNYWETIQEMYQNFTNQELFEPISTNTKYNLSQELAEDDDYNVYPCLMTLTVPVDAECIISKNMDNSNSSNNNNGNSLFLKTMPNVVDEDYDFSFPFALDSIYEAPIISFGEDHDNNNDDNANSKDTDFTTATTTTTTTESNKKSYYSVQVLLHFVSTEEILWDADMDVVESKVITRIQEEFQNHTTVEGVVVSDNAVDDDLRTQLVKDIQALTIQQEQEGKVDYHPHSNHVVRDIVHPALYSYIRGTSTLRANVSDSAPCHFKELEKDDDKDDDKGDDEGELDRDYWGRKYEESKYQWLPTYFEISDDGKCTIEDYINNLTPRQEDLVNHALYGSLAKLFEQCLPHMESVYSYVHAVRPLMQSDEDNWYPEYLTDVPELPIEDFISFRGQRLQVITKIVDYELRPGQSYEGVWHVEGMSHEEIVLTALYILERDDDIEGGELRFQRSFHKDEADTVRSTLNQVRPQALDEFIQKGLLPLGTVETLGGRLIVFPNSHVHKVDKMVNQQPVMTDINANSTTTTTITTSAEDDGEDSSTSHEKVAKRRIVVFFLVNPLRRIVSTREVSPQQDILSLEEALDHRLELMKERKFHKQDWNVREVELCEH